MRKLSFLLLVLGPLFAARAQAPAAGSDWSRVQRLPAHARVHIKADHGGSTCRIDKVDDDSLTCRGAMGGVHSYPRAEVKSVKLSRYATSTVAGTLIGAGGGFAVGASLPNGKSSLFTRAQIGGIFAAPGAVIGAVLGGTTDFTEGTIYRRAKSIP